MKLLLLIISISLSASSLAGSRTGYRLVFVEISSKQSPAVSKMLENYFNSELPANTYRCPEKNQFIEFDYVYIRQQPRGITIPLARAALNFDRRATESLRTTLRAFRNSEIDHGFDGLLVFNNDKNRLELTTIGTIANGYRKTVKLNLQKNPSSGDLNKLFCDSLADLEYAYGNR
ncbi:MAG TPA: hypothetical protein VF450_06700 [Noviherbaspirillum sp.]